MKGKKLIVAEENILETIFKHFFEICVFLAFFELCK
jgi:hypothetical protein